MEKMPQLLLPGDPPWPCRSFPPKFANETEVVELHFFFYCILGTFLRQSKNLPRKDLIAVVGGEDEGVLQLRWPFVPDNVARWHLGESAEPLQAGPAALPAQPRQALGAN